MKFCRNQSVVYKMTSEEQVLFRTCLQHLTLSEVLVHIQIIVRNKSEPLDTLSSFCKSLDE